MIKQLPISVDAGRKNDVRTQFAALCYRIKDGKVQILMVTTRRTGRWIIPKGWPMTGETPGDAAATEAWEEAGVKGKVATSPIGLFSYQKFYDSTPDLPCVVVVYPLHVSTVSKSYPEASERKRKWVSRKRAAKMVREVELARILKDFDPRR